MNQPTLYKLIPQQPIPDEESVITDALLKALKGESGVSKVRAGVFHLSFNRSQVKNIIYLANLINGPELQGMLEKVEKEDSDETATDETTDSAGTASAATNPSLASADEYVSIKLYEQAMDRIELLESSTARQELALKEATESIRQLGEQLRLLSIASPQNRLIGEKPCYEVKTVKEVKAELVKLWNESDQKIDQEPLKAFNNLKPQDPDFSNLATIFKLFRYAKQNNLDTRRCLMMLMNGQALGRWLEAPETTDKTAIVESLFYVYVPHFEKSYESILWNSSELYKPEEVLSWITRVQDLTTTIIRVTNEADFYATVIIPKLPEWAIRGIDVSRGLPPSSYLYLIGDIAQRRAAKKTNKTKQRTTTPKNATNSQAATTKSRGCNHCNRPGHNWQDCKSLQALNENTRKEATALLQQGYTFDKYPDNLRQKIAQERQKFWERTKSNGANTVATVPNPNPKNDQ